MKLYRRQLQPYSQIHLISIPAMDRSRWGLVNSSLSPGLS
jgi:hypothetical protein